MKKTIVLPLLLSVMISGCKTYMDAYIPAKASEENKLPLSLFLDFSCKRPYCEDGQMYDAYYYALEDYFYKNITNKKDEGSLEIKCTRLNPHKSEAELVYCAMIISPILLFGVPLGTDHIGVNCDFNIKDKNGNTIKSYHYAYSEKNLRGLYYGKGYRRFAFDEAVSLMERFCADYIKDLKEIRYALQHPGKAVLGYLCLTNPFTKPVYFEIDGKYNGVIPASSYKTIEIPVGQHKITSYKSFYTTTTSQEVGGTLIFGFGSTTITSTQNYEGLTYEQARKQVEPNTFRVNVSKNKTTYIDHEKQVSASIISQNHYTEVAEMKSVANNTVPHNATTNNSRQNTSPDVFVQNESNIDENIPSINTPAEDTYVLIIVNEQYDNVDNVNYALHDGEIFKEYCIKTLGVPRRQIIYYENAALENIEDGVSKLEYCLNNFGGSKAIVYYRGHGIPEVKAGEAYLIPTDGKVTDMNTCYHLNTLYKTLAATPTENVAYFMDAAFTKENKEGRTLVSDYSVPRELSTEISAGKSIIFYASSDDEKAMTLDEQRHGLFTYYLLKKLQETEGNVTYGELSDYIKKNVQKDAYLINEKSQTPVVITSPMVVNIWRDMKLK